MLSKRHYERIAEIVNGLTLHRPAMLRDPIIYRDDLVKFLAAYFLEDNPRFDFEKFEAACIKEG